ncbi:MAG: DUF1934 domain-containing protein [Clostridia bacterium]|nr:DUF1934 domain-containing protein [Clostridia bacterium]
MMKNVLIKITGTQGLGEETDSVELTTEGKMGIKDGKFLLTYDESELLGVKGIKTSLMIKDDDTVILQRSGGYASRLVVQKGVRNSCFYSTPHGDLSIGIFGEAVSNNLTVDGGTVNMSYTIDSNLQLISRNTVEISVRGVN